MLIKDREVRHLVHQRLLHRHHANSRTLVIDELGINHGKSRIDIAILNGHLTGIEIKSEADSLDRLHHQVASYGQVAQKSVLVVAKKHYAKSAEMLPDWWGVITFDSGPRGGVFFETVRKPLRNPDLDKTAFARLLWRSEAQELLARFGAPKETFRSRRADMYEWLSNKLPEKTLSKSVLERLKARTNWRCPEPLLQGGD